MECLDEATSSSVIKRLETPAVGSRSNASNAFLRDLISTVITLAINSGDYIASGEPDFATCSHRVSEDQRLIRIAIRSNGSDRATSPARFNYFEKSILN